MCLLAARSGPSPCLALEEDRSVMVSLRLKNVLLTICLFLPWSGSLLAADDIHPLLIKGVATYKTFCAHCHGLNMVNPGTSSYDLRKWPLENKDAFYNSVTNGKGSMPAWGDIIRPEELDAVWVYVASRGGKEAVPDNVDPLGGDDVNVEDVTTDEEDQSSSEEPALDPDKSTQNAMGVQDELARLLAAPPETLEADTLKACLQRNGGALSGWRQDGGVGLDYELVRHVAQRLELDLDIVWFEGELEEESDPVRENYALLALELCDVVAGHPLVAGAIGEPPAPRAAPPRWTDQPFDWDPRRHVDLQPVAHSTPYLRVEMGIVYNSERVTEVPASLAAFSSLSVGVEQGTIAGLLTLRQSPPDVATHSQTSNPGPVFLWKLEQGEFDAALINVPAYDFHKRQNPITSLKLSDYRHPLAFNIGLAMLESAKSLQAHVNAIIGDDLENGKIKALAKLSHLHYALPVEPWVAPRMSLQQLIASGS